MTHELTSHPSVRTARFEVPSLESPVSALPLTRLSINEVTTFKWLFEDDVCGYRDAGIPAMGIWRPKLFEFGEDRGVELIRESGLHVSSVAWVGGFTGQNDQSYRDAIREAIDTIRIAGELGADAVTLISGGRYGHTRNHARRIVVDALNELSDEAAAAGVALAVQPMHAQFSNEWTFLNTLDETLAILDRCRHPSAQLHFDAFQLCREPRLLDRIREIADRTAVVQLSDWDGTSVSQLCRRLPGDGVLPLGMIADAFVSAGYDGYFEISAWSEKVWQTDYQFVLADCVNRYRQMRFDSAAATSRSG